MMPSEDLLIKITELGVVGMAALALVLVALSGILQSRKSGKTDQMESAKDLKTLELMDKMFDQAAERDKILTAIAREQRTIAIHNAKEHERIMKTQTDTKTEAQQTNRVLGEIMNELTKEEEEPTTTQKLDLLISLLGDLKDEVIALKGEFAGFSGRIETVETDVGKAQTAITDLADQVRKETQETPVVTGLPVTKKQTTQ